MSVYFDRIDTLSLIVNKFNKDTIPKNNNSFSTKALYKDNSSDLEQIKETEISDKSVDHDSKILNFLEQLESSKDEKELSVKAYCLINFFNGWSTSWIVCCGRTCWCTTATGHSTHIRHASRHTTCSGSTSHLLKNRHDNCFQLFLLFFIFFLFGGRVAVEP